MYWAVVLLLGKQILHVLDGHVVQELASALLGSQSYGMTLSKLWNEAVKAME